MDTEQAIEKAYNDHVSALYKALSQAILFANGNDDEIMAAEARFQKGLIHAADVRERARRLADLE